MTFGFGTFWSREFCQCGLALGLGNRTKLWLAQSVAGGQVPFGVWRSWRGDDVGDGSCGLLADLVVVPGDGPVVWSGCFLARELVRLFHHCRILWTLRFVLSNCWLLLKRKQ